MAGIPICSNLHLLHVFSMFTYEESLLWPQYLPFFSCCADLRHSDLFHPTVPPYSSHQLISPCPSRTTGTCDLICSVNAFSLTTYSLSSLLKMLHSSWKQNQCPNSVFLTNSTPHISQWLVLGVMILSRKKAGNPFLSEAGWCAPSLPTVRGESVKALSNLFPHLRLWAQSCPQCPGWPQISLRGM